MLSVTEVEISNCKGKTASIEITCLQIRVREMGFLLQRKSVFQELDLYSL